MMPRKFGLKLGSAASPTMFEPQRMTQLMQKRARVFRDNSAVNR